MAAKRPGTSTKRSAQRKTNSKAEAATETLIEMTLRISERYGLIRFLPDFGSIEEVTNIGFIHEILSLDTAERIMWGVHEEGGQVFWVTDGDTPIAMTFEQWLVIKKGAKFLDQQKRFPAPPTFLAVYQRLLDLLSEHE